MMMSGIKTDHDPGAVHKFRAGDDGGRDGRGDGADAVHDELPLPVGSSLHEPTADHAGLREGEGEEDADGIERNECVGVACEDDNQQAGERIQGS